VTDGQTDGQTDGRTDVQPISITCFSIADARKNFCKYHKLSEKTEYLLKIHKTKDIYTKMHICWTLLLNYITIVTEAKKS